MSSLGMIRAIKVVHDSNIAAAGDALYSAAQQTVNLGTQNV